MKRLYFISKAFILLVLITACNQQPEIDMSEALGKSKETLREIDEIETTSASFNGESDVKFRFMVERHPTEEEANILFNKILDSIAQHSHHSEVWNYYDGYFDIKSYDSGVIYEATKLIGKDLHILSK
ncbi:hypothetical protein ACFFHM_12780 [Halalkalibacter kiskunsagensis]|uniref:4a-hydroxytetrahydrobiopterin dehydratase n=1 Tax=Halalkalibacter kiskunsagensis TaxID=1548599 RepID=A0ABV6KDE8_9BACI